MILILGMVCLMICWKMKNKYLIVLAGPTAVGKTSLGIVLAKAFQTEIISADSRQMYREMKIGTAVPNESQLKEIPHHFIQFLSIHEYYNASMYEQQALALLSRLFEQKDILLMVGGSGLYIQAVCKGIDDLPGIDHEIRNELQERYKKEGIESLRFDLKRLDPDYYNKVDLQNPNRILKALEISYMTGKPYSSLLTNPLRERQFNTIMTGLNMDRERLYSRINNRVDQMIQDGLVEEARKLMEHKHLNALNTVGYKELFQFFDGKLKLDQAIEQIKNNTRNYARKQITWFNRDRDLKWFEPDNREDIISFIKQQIDE